MQAAASMTAQGIVLHRIQGGGLVIVDPWQRGGDRTNSNFVVMGNSGVGKSTAIKHIILSEFMKGTKIFVIDPESEYKDLCHNLGGDWVNAVGGSAGRINPLQVRPSRAMMRGRRTVIPGCGQRPL